METLAMSYYEKYGVLLSPSKSWEFMNYGFSPEGMGDCISRTMDEARKNKGGRYLINCYPLLCERKRWPDELQEINKDRIAKNKLQEWWSKLIQTPTKPCLYRPQNNMTRDPYFYFYAACIELGYYHAVKSIKPPWWLFSPPLWTWRRYIITGKGKWLYELMDKINLWIGVPDYALKMINIRKEITP